MHLLCVFPIGCNILVKSYFPVALISVILPTKCICLVIPIAVNLIMSSLMPKVFLGISIEENVACFSDVWCILGLK